ncbi:MAG: WecB/TagA/CpsF family glycosyltransferase [Caldilineaceae bacterium]
MSGWEATGSNAVHNGDFFEVAAVEILGVRIDCVDFAQTLAIIQYWIEQAATPNLLSPTRQICTANPEFVMHARRDPTFAAVLRKADLVVADGGGLLWAARRQGVQLRERVTGSDGIYRICEQAAQAGWTVFFLGAAPGVADRAAQRLQLRYPGLQVAGVYSGSPAASDWPSIQARLDQTKPNILFVAYGHPLRICGLQRTATN